MFLVLFFFFCGGRSKIVFVIEVEKVIFLCYVENFNLFVIEDYIIVCLCNLWDMIWILYIYVLVDKEKFLFVDLLEGIFVCMLLSKVVVYLFVYCGLFN